MNSVYDYIIVGAGSAGCVLANRLSANADHEVLLLEAGQDFAPGPEPADIRDPYPLSSYNSSYFWGDIKAFWGNSGSGGAVKFPQARVVGGGSCVAGMVAFRGTAEDYAEWERMGAQGWAWEDVLPYFRKLETDQDFRDASHGASGPIPIRRVPRESWPPLTHAIAGYAEAEGFPFIADMNSDFREGFGATPISSTDAGRITTAAGYLTPDVRARPNLTIRPRAVARTLVIQDGTATGVAVEIDGRTVTFSGREVILSAGAIHTPSLLLRSGVGDADGLRRLGIPVRADRRGVGKNLQNHAALFIGAVLPRGFRQGQALRTHPTACFRLSSGLDGAPGSDVYINIQSKTSWNAMGNRLASLNAVLLKPQGAGEVSLKSADPTVAPLVEFGFGMHEGDIRRLAEGLRQIIKLLGSSRVAPRMGRPFVVRVGDRIRKWNAHTAVNAVQSRLFAVMLDMMPLALADRLLARMTGEAVDLARLVGDTEALVDFVRREVSGVYHPVGTCRMGRVNDPDAVVDAKGRVIGMAGLRIVDASIMPTIPRGNTNIPTIMVAEKLAAHIIEEERS